jgi:nucleotide-binding universal stress UspA family protein
VQYVHGTPEARGGLEEVAFGHAGFDPESGSAFPMPQAHVPESVRRPIEDEALDKLRDQVPEGFTGTWEAKVIPGKAADVIVQTAQAQRVDLIVMGTHGRTGLSHTLLGSVAEAVLRHAPCPVLMVQYER